MPDESKGPNPVPPQPAARSRLPSRPHLQPKRHVAIQFFRTRPEAPAGPNPLPQRQTAKPAAPATCWRNRQSQPRPLPQNLPSPAAAKPAPKPEGPKPEPWDSDLVTRLRSQYGSGIREASTYVGQKYLVVDSSIVYEILLRMRDDEHFDYCVDITAVH